ncbi:hypothetical protein [Streptomyces sp. NPDC098781]|uniref:hypothetical protein n=1 Tax=Streptomyces sp. NPDC098781 TaxID=3366097 RepID=UPI00382475AF
MGSEQHVCPDCGQPLEMVVKRHKTLGAWVPTWVDGPCRNPDCAAHPEDGAEHEEKREEKHEQPVQSEQSEQTGTPTAKNS